MEGKPKLLRVPSAFHSVDGVLDTARAMDLPNIIILAQRENGNLIFLESDEMTVAHANWIIDQYKAILLGECRKVE